jgi:hypothetical protein
VARFPFQTQTVPRLVVYRNSSGTFAIFAAIRRASARVSSLAAERRARLVLEIDVVSACPLWSRMTKAAPDAVALIQVF